MRSCSALTRRVVAEHVVAQLGARPSPRASPAVGRVTVSLRRSTIVRHARSSRKFFSMRMAMLGEDRLGMELHAFERRARAGQLAVAHAHDLAVVSAVAVTSSSAGRLSRSITSEW